MIARPCLLLRLNQLRAVNGEHRPLRTTGAVRVWMNHLDAGLSQINEVMDRFRISLTDDDDEGRFVDNASIRELTPIGGDDAGLLQAINVALDGEDGDLRINALNNLIRDRLRSGEG